MIDTKVYSERILNGFSQVFLQENKWTGALFLAGLLIGHWSYALAGLLAVIAGNLTAHFLKYSEKESQSGLYGFSPALVGVALLVLFPGSWLIWLLVILGGALAALVQNFFIRNEFPGYTFPFILVAWLFYFLLTHFLGVDLREPFADPDFLKVESELLAIPKGFGQVMFQGSITVGLLFLFGVFINKPIAALYGVLAAVLGGLLANWNYLPSTDIAAGIYGFNPVLTAIVFAGAKKTDGLWVFIGVIVTFLIQKILMETQVLDVVGGIFTFPFVAGTWVTLIIQKKFKMSSYEV